MCYNIAYNYLKEKYGYNRVYLLENARKKIRFVNKKQREEIIKTFTDRDYHISLNEVTEEDDKYIQLLMGQYYYGQAAKNELRAKLINLGVIEE